LMTSGSSDRGCPATMGTLSDDGKASIRCASRVSASPQNLGRGCRGISKISCIKRFILGHVVAEFSGSKQRKKSLTCTLALSQWSCSEVWSREKNTSPADF
jgi:hypothetical protein